ncbi:MAG: hypothetical protein ACI9FD_004698 [Gammaproteobacteria bacterium]|jgi:hypothetical protein
MEVFEMNKFAGGRWFRPLVWAVAFLMPVSALADENYDLLKAQVEALQEQLLQVQEVLQQYEGEKVTQTEIADLRSEISEAAEWKEPNTLIHMSGYADINYIDANNSDGAFNVGTFSPIFHYQYRDLVMLESEMEVEIDENGNTETALEYLTIDLFLNDNLTLVAGKFLSPVGQFRQNLHPSWINKLASAPPGFGHDGAAPVSEMGVQARGGFEVGNRFANYAVFAGNGPKLQAVFEDDEFELAGIEAEGFGSDNDGKKVFGGRFAFLPISGLEIGFSAITGKATVSGIEDAHGGEEPAEHGEEPGEEPEGEHDKELDLASLDLSLESPRDYDVYGFDFAWRLNNINFRGEYVKTKVGADNLGITASPGASWETWYSQASYAFPQTKWETALRYTDFDSPHSSEDQQQWAIGFNYLFASSVIGKLTYELNDGQVGSKADTDRFLFQLAYGF